MAIRKEYRERCRRYKFPLFSFYEMTHMLPGEWEEIAVLMGLDPNEETPEDEAVREIVERSAGR